MKICELLNIKYPIIQGAMAWISYSDLASAVSNAGGLGVLSLGNMDGELTRKAIRDLKSKTDKPFGVNLMIIGPNAKEQFKVILEEKPPVVTTGAGSPKEYMPLLQEAGIKVIPVVPNVKTAKKVEEMGADAVIVEGMESGGHIGEMTTMCLAPQAIDAVNIPVIVAGGIADGRGLAAAIMFGCDGVQIGTRFITAKECSVHRNYKDEIIKARDTDTIVTGLITGHPVRGIKNETSVKMIDCERKGDVEGIEKLGTGSFRRAAVEGDVETGSVMSGQIVGLVNEEITCKEIIEEIMEEAKAVINKSINVL